MGSLGDRLRKLEERLVLMPSIDECLNASNRERVRALHTITERLASHGFDGVHLFTEHGLSAIQVLRFVASSGLPHR
jgi:hypothetical protein